MLFVQWLRYGIECLRNGSARGDCMHMRLLIVYNTTTRCRGRERERAREWERREKEERYSERRRLKERGREDTYTCTEHVRTEIHAYTCAAPWCTVERKYKRLKAKRKQTGSSLSKPNSGGVKLRHAAGSPSERGNFLSFVSHYISALLF